MASYGRNFDFRVPPRSGERSGRWVLTGADVVAIGAPVIIDTVSTASSLGTGVQNVKLATGNQAPKLGLSGVMVYEYAPAAFAGDDPFLTLYSDKDTVHPGQMVQVISGESVKVAFHNTAARTFLNTRAYAGRVMVAGIGIATPTIAVGDWLTPGVGNDTSGYWTETSTASEAWLVVTSVDNTRAEVEARLVF